MTKHVVEQCRLHRFAYLIIRIILCDQLWFTHTIPPLYFSSMSSAPELNTGNIALAETTSESLLVEKPLGPVSIDPIETSYRKISWSLEAVRFVFSQIPLTSSAAEAPVKFQIDAIIVQTTNLEVSWDVMKRLIK